MTADLLAVLILISLLPVLGFATETEVFTEDFATDLGNWIEDAGTVDGGVMIEAAAAHFFALSVKKKKNATPSPLRLN